MKDTMSATRRGSLTVIGTGIQAGGQLTLEAKGCAEMADKLLYLVTDPVAAGYLTRLNPTAQSLHGLYSEGKPRIDTYLEMVEEILAPVRLGKRVCAAFYGHPGIFGYPSHEAIKKARSEGFPARMLPALSAEDCLFADLGFDPVMGCQSFEATSFLLRKAIVDPTCLLILWQIGVIGDYYTSRSRVIAPQLALLTDYLREFYDANQPTIIYEASIYLTSAPRIEQVPLIALPEQEISSISTLCIPPARPFSCDDGMIQKLGLDRGQLNRVNIQLRIPKTSGPNPRSTA